MKLPNGYGSVYKLPGNRRKPWAVRITVSREERADGSTKWTYKYLGYYETQAAALTALAQYNENPFDLDVNKITFAEVYEKWSREHYPKISKSTAGGYEAAYKLCDQLSTLRFCDIRKSHLQGVVDTCGKNYPILKWLKVLYSALFKYGLENDICVKDYAKYVDITQYKDKNPNSKERTVFSAEELEVLWETNKDHEYLSTILMLVYSGVRVTELLDLKKEDVHLSEKWFQVTASKTSAGIRQVPIAEKILPFFQHWMQKNDSDYLLSTPDGKHLSYHNYYKNYWTPLLDKLDIPNHRPHDTRHTCISMLATSKVDDKIIKRIVGHSGQSITESVYTHFDIQLLIDAINKI